ncbi:N-acetyllactosaminide beta-1,3-N-acetylglucosaminyltransferase 2 [Synchiropus splendidus]|uniref:N-acetyllactosaminide beta-1,3-N-acetylglucosaminyltransferase 2 n=1 Tax=Synchiropus splendidus TaxID=270530 RepID=UPI00237E7C6A|nr:N-acetyllactosaminide beta-1,3-N-acetylglucosaminyltransferase 2 [Synchiropus splendidus]
MRPLRTFSVMVLSVALVLFLVYTNFRSESRHLDLEDLKRLSNRAQEQNVKAKATAGPAGSPNSSISERLKKIIPQNRGYWNRLLYSSLHQLDTEKQLYTQEPVWSQCRETSHERLRTNVYDLALYPPMFLDFLKGMNCRSPPLLINQPQKCFGDSVNETFLLFAIKSIPGNFLQRQAVRETWGQEISGRRSIRLVFLLGTSLEEDPDINLLLQFEARHYRDILQWDFHESFFNLTLKLNMFLQWSLKFCSHASFVFSGDDDVFVNTPALLRYLQSRKPPLTSRLYTGHIIRQATPVRDPKSKYYIPQSFYDGPYPAYAGGGGYLISGDLLKPLYSVSLTVPFMPIDDVYIGVCVKALDVSAENHLGFQTFDIKENDRENLCVYENLILIHRRTPQQAKKLWKGIHSPLLTC